MKFYRCAKCGKIIGMIQSSPCPTMCCGEAMEALEANTTDAAQEKHVPVITIDGNIITVEVGSAAHPMLAEHYIQWIALETKEGMQRKELAPEAAPKAVFALADGDAAV
ncbi:MAG: desulfoferrodoxin, partial [Eubacterium sp.]|nr:desulfoferrodoxin [Eubacterium sp.]